MPEGRTKPWGTGQAVLVAKDLVPGPFAVINADDYYGKEAFSKIYSFLTSEVKDNAFCMAGFVLKNTLSDNGAVTRGICKVGENGYLSDVVETHDIVKTADGAESGGVKVDVESLVSMNMWGLSTEYMNMLESGFDKVGPHIRPGLYRRPEKKSGVYAAGKAQGGFRMGFEEIL